jgi:hypothetical protein
MLQTQTPLNTEADPAVEQEVDASSPTPPPDSRDSVASVIGPEAANLLCTIVVQGFDVLHFESFLVGSVKQEGESMDVGDDVVSNLSATERRALFDQYTEALLKGCSAILVSCSKFYCGYCTLTC